ncbi:hypothetical protein [Botrimarina colliarenosi]|nr:hypothetical protein [Botrimarina colliarenosi]
MVRTKSFRPQPPVALAVPFAAILLALTGVANAQVNYEFQPQPTDPESSRLWQENANWFDANLGNSFVPNVFFNERALINNGATAVLTVNSPNDPNSDTSVVTPGAVSIGSGGLDIRSGGGLFVTAGNGAPGSFTLGGGGTGTLLVNPGGELSVASSLNVAGNSANTITVGGPTGATATLSANSAVLSGTTHLYPNADVNIGAGVQFVNSSVYQVEIGGPASYGSIAAGGPVTTAGSLQLNFSGFTPTTGQSWVVLEGSSVSGSFANVSSNASLDYNETVVVSEANLGAGRFGVRASIEEVLVLEVNRNTGVATVTHPGSSSIALDGYYVGSSLGSLRSDDGSWNSLNESGQLGNDWIETAQTVNNVGELKVGADATFGASVNLGPIYNALAGSFGESGEDLEFVYRRSSDGVQFPGVVRYTGDLVNSLVLQVDPSGSGDAYLRNTSGTTVEIDAYEVLSSAGRLSTSGWSSFDDQNGTGNAWLEAGDVGPSLLAEFDSEGYTTIAAGASLNLGSLYSGGAQDLEFNFLLRGDESSTTGVVIYDQYVAGPAVPGDFNNDGFVNAADYTDYRDNVGASSLPNDNGLGVVGPAHYQLWRDNYGATSPAAAQASVPEPAAGVLIAIAALAAGRRRSA